MRYFIYKKHLILKKLILTLFQDKVSIHYIILQIITDLSADIFAMRSDI